MLQPIVLQLQELASESRCDSVELLQKALIVATKLDLADFRAWLMNELNGYEDLESLPSYRIITSDLRVQNPFRGLIPFLINNPEIASTVKTVYVGEPLASVVHLVSDTTRGTIMYPFAPAQEAMLMQMQNDLAPLRPLRVVSPNQLSAIIQAVRTRVLDWALTLEKEGIVGDGLSFSAKEKDIARTSHNIRIDNFQGILGDIHGGSVSQSNVLTIASGDWTALSKYMAQQGIASGDIEELRTAISTDTRPTVPTKFGARVSTWIGKMVSKAAEGTWEVSVATAGTLLANAISKYYGLG